MLHFDRINSWILLGIGVLHCAMTFVLAGSWNQNAMWFFAAGLALIYAAALNLLRIRYADAAPGVRTVSFAVNLTQLGFILAYAALAGRDILRNPAAVLLMVGVAAAVLLSLPRSARAAQRERMLLHF
jgi:hypothetical protein